MAQSGHPGVSDRCPLMTQCGPRLFGRGHRGRERRRSKVNAAVQLHSLRDAVGL